MPHLGTIRSPAGFFTPSQPQKFVTEKSFLDQKKKETKNEAKSRRTSARESKWGKCGKQGEREKHFFCCVLLYVSQFHSKLEAKRIPLRRFSLLLSHLVNEKEEEFFFIIFQVFQLFFRSRLRWENFFPFLVLKSFKMK